MQGVADMAMWLTAAAAGGLSGLIVGAWGYAALTLFSALLAAGVVVAATLGSSRRVAT